MRRGKNLKIIDKFPGNSNNLLIYIKDEIKGRGFVSSFIVIAGIGNVFVLPADNGRICLRSSLLQNLRN